MDDGLKSNRTSCGIEVEILTPNTQAILEMSSQESKPNVEDKRILAQIESAKKAETTSSEFSYNDRDAILYNIGIGAKKDELPLVFEGNTKFQVLPTFGTIPQYFVELPYNREDIMRNYDSRMLLHGEQYLEILQYPLPTSATLSSKLKLIEVVDKGSAAIVREGVTTVDKTTGRPLFYSEMLLFIRGAGGFAGGKKASDRGTATAENKVPSRSPDVAIEERTTPEQAALYRLSGDLNPLHIDPTFSTAGGFKMPILHGLCFFGISGKHVYQQYGPFRNIKVRFTGTVLPGQTLVTEMWKEGQKVIYQVRVKETGKLCIANAAAELVKDTRASM